MKEIPQHCVDTFKERFGVHPSIVEVYPTMSKEDTDKLLNKSHTLWFDYFVNNEHKKIKNGNYTRIITGKN
jgi:enoyl reductase-like protein